MNIFCEYDDLTKNYTCSTSGIAETPAYISTIDAGNGQVFYYSDILTPTDFLLVFFFLLFLIIFLTKGIFNFVYRTIVFMKQKL